MRRRLAVLTAVPLLLGLAACGGSGSPSSSPSHGASSPSQAASSPSQAASPSSQPPKKVASLPGVSVSSGFGKEPSVKVDAPLKLDRPEYTVVQQGHGSKVAANKQALVNLVLVDGKTGKKAASTFGQSAPYYLQSVSSTQFFPAVIDAIKNQPVGTRVAVAMPAADAYGAKGNPQLKIGPNDPVVFVVDVVSTEATNVLSGPQGSKNTHLPKNLPTVVEKNGKVSKLDFSHAPKKPSNKLQVYTLVKGHGAPVRKPSLVTFNYLGQIYGTDKVFDESYSSSPRTFPIGMGRLIKAWDQGMVGLRTGSRVLMIVPPSYGYGKSGQPQSKPPIKGTDTLAFVIDILGVG